MALNKTNYKQLMKFERQFSTAVYSNYAIISLKDYNYMIDAYYGNSINKMQAMKNYECARCRLKEIIKIGKEYFNYVEKCKEELEEKRTIETIDSPDED